jgi:hypothetical protein
MTLGASHRGFPFDGKTIVVNHSRNIPTNLPQLWNESLNSNGQQFHQYQQ